jgi:DinB superfamily
MPTSADQPPVDGYCDECGFDYEQPDLESLLARLGRQAAEYPLALTGQRSRLRPDPDTWSALEYACHVRDVLSVQRDRITQTLAEDHPTYVPMNREQRLIDDNYNQQDPVAVGSSLVANAKEFVAAGSALSGDELLRTGVYNYPTPTDRSLGWLLHHVAHEVQHHLYDVRRVLA